MHSVYVLKSKKEGKLYVGCTENVLTRITQHNAGSVPSTKGRRPLEVIYFEQYEDKFNAFRMEKFYKTASGKRILKSKLALLEK